MPTAILVLGLAFVILGGVLLLIRLYYVWGKGDVWNNMPTEISWGFTVIAAGTAVFLVGISTGRCPDECERVDGTTPGSTMVSGAIVVGIGLSLIFCTCCCKKRDNEGEGTMMESPPKQEDSYWSGLDFVSLGIGLALLATQESIGVCPQSCATAVVLHSGSR
jgi:hypothetical protein